MGQFLHFGGVCQAFSEIKKSFSEKNFKGKTQGSFVKTLLKKEINKYSVFLIFQQIKKHFF